ncbi:MAG TPA: choice-of-anchor E domain-containing protein [Isosphaeraceae bacterium]|nr:choice-of-anchor E domain-containing protein [Isosphaeraceae bacterium]
MNAVGWMWLRRLLQRALSPAGKANRYPQRRRKTAPILQSLEAIELLSGVAVIGRPLVQSIHAKHHPLSGQVSRLSAPDASGMSDSASSPVTLTLPAQTVSIGKTLTNFANMPLTPALNLFDPSLGTLISVGVSHTVVIQSNIISQNLSPTSPTVITASVTGSFQIDGLNQPISLPTQTVTSQPISVGVFGSGTDTVIFPPLQIANSSSETITDPAGLAFYTASPGRNSITLTMSATATASASAPNGNLSTTTESFASGTQVTIAYTYVPECPTAVGIGRIGLHHQQTQIVVTYSGVVNPVLAENPNDYTVITRTGKKIPIISATFNPSTNSVTLIPAHRLNVHHHFLLSAKPPCPIGQPGNAQIIPFGGKQTLLGFYNHRGQFVPFHPRGSAGSESRRGQSVAIHQSARSQT